MPLAPHRELTDDQLEACRQWGVPAPPVNCKVSARCIFDFRDPGPNPRLSAPISFRWRFGPQGQLLAFVAYGRRKSPAPVGKKRARPREFYGPLPAEERDHHAKALLEDADV